MWGAPGAARTGERLERRATTDKHRTPPRAIRIWDTRCDPSGPQASCPGCPAAAGGAVRGSIRAAAALGSPRLPRRARPRPGAVDLDRHPVAEPGPLHRRDARQRRRPGLPESRVRGRRRRLGRWNVGDPQRVRGPDRPPGGSRPRRRPDRGHQPRARTDAGRDPGLAELRRSAAARGPRLRGPLLRRAPGGRPRLRLPGADRRGGRRRRDLGDAAARPRRPALGRPRASGDRLLAPGTVGAPRRPARRPRDRLRLGLLPAGRRTPGPGSSACPASWAAQRQHADQKTRTGQERSLAEQISLRRPRRGRGERDELRGHLLGYLLRSLPYQYAHRARGRIGVGAVPVDFEPPRAATNGRPRSRVQA